MLKVDLKHPHGLLRQLDGGVVLAVGEQIPLDHEALVLLTALDDALQQVLVPLGDEVPALEDILGTKIHRPAVADEARSVANQVKAARAFIAQPATPKTHVSRPLLRSLLFDGRSSSVILSAPQILIGRGRH